MDTYSPSAPALKLTPDAAAAHARAVVEQSGTSFAFGMKILPKPRREGMFAVYAFCREIDDIADGDGIHAKSTTEEKRAALNGWRREIDALYEGRPTWPTAVALAGPIERYALDREEFILLIEGMEMDLDGPVQGPTLEVLSAYCRRVAGAVGMLSMPIFGAPPGEASDRFALSLADGLQFTNILRDVGTDAAMDRLYLPVEFLERHGVTTTIPEKVLHHPATPEACEDLGRIARQRFAETRAALKDLDWRVLRPALLMMGVYEETLKRLEARGFQVTGDPVALSKTTKIMIAMRYALAPPLTRAP